MDNIILIVFGPLSVLALGLGIASFWMATKHAKRPNGEGKMITWAIVGLAGFIFSLTSFVYFILPILVARLQ
jgi:hypothetical protein